MDALDDEGHFVGTSLTGNNGSGKINTQPALTENGEDGQNATYTIQIPGGPERHRHHCHPAAMRRFNSTTILFISDSTTGDGITARYDGGTNELTIEIQNGITTADVVVDAVNNETSGNFTAERSDAPTYSTTLITKGGTSAGSTKALTVYNNGSVNNDKIEFKARNNGNAGNEYYNNYTIEFVDDGTLTGTNDATVTFDSGAKKLTIVVASGTTTAATVVAKVTANGAFDAIFATTLVADPDTTGAGVVTAPRTFFTHEVVTSGGVDGAPATVTVTPPSGSNNGVVITADSDGTALNDVVIAYFDDGSVTTNNAIPNWNGSDLLTININSGTTTAEKNHRCAQ